MEYTQWAVLALDYHWLVAGLNPCCNGIYSMSVSTLGLTDDQRVLILVVMEYTQWGKLVKELTVKSVS